VRNIAGVTTAVARGDLTTKITVDAQGEILELKNTINTMVDQLSSFASEVTRVAREVGTEGKLGGQAVVKGVAGTWKDLTESVNSMASNLTNQVRNIAEVTTAVARGDLSKKITVDVRGEILELKNTINTMVDQLNAFAGEVTRVAREVGSEGKLGGQAEVKGVGGVWKDLTENVNSMAGNLTGQVRNIAEVTTAVARGDLSKKITVDVRGEILELKNTINTMVDQLNAFAGEVTRVAREVGSEGKLGGQAYVRGVGGVWKDLTDSVNSMASNLTNQVRNIAHVTTAVANGDLSRKITVDVQGEILELKNTINTMVDQLNSFASEVTRVAREVGTEGKLGGQAVVKGVAGTWKDLTDNVNSMAANLTTQVRGIAKVVTAVANGDLKRKLVLETKGEIAELADTINGMIDTLAVFADQVTTVAREVGIEGKLGGQARVPGAAGIWRDLTDNVNELAAKLTTQVRAIAEVATAVTKGDLTRSIAVEAQGELAALTDTINEMIANLRETTRKNTEQDWLKTNLARFTRMLQGQRDLLAVARLVLSELTPLVGAQHAVFYINDDSNDNEPVLKLLASYAYKERKNLSSQFKPGEGLVGQCALEKQSILLTEVPPDYIKISSGLGEATPLNVIVQPVLFEGDVTAVVELASFHRFSDTHLAFLDQLMESLGIVLKTIAATMRTEELLKQSQALAEELQTRQEELTRTNERLQEQARDLRASEDLLRQQREALQHTNAELAEKAELLEEQKSEVERKNREVEQAKKELEEKAEQLALTSQYKSQFLANMSHELRTPLNNMLILAKVLAENADANLTPKQVKFADTIYTSGTDLLALINDILDLSKIESGTMAMDVGRVLFSELEDYLTRSFRHVAEEKALQFVFEVDPGLPPAIQTDLKRLHQVLKNLVSNALKFTEKGSVTVRLSPAEHGWSPEHEVLNAASSVIAFSVADTGIGIAPEQQRAIFEAFRQADGTTSRKYGGTGLGLSISRELARLLGGEIKVESVVGEGSTFTLYLPEVYTAPAPLRPVSPQRAAAPAAVEAAPSGEALLSPGAAALIEDVADDRGAIQPGDRVLLIVEDDPTFSQILIDLAHEKGFKAAVSSRGGKALDVARELKPDAITLDIRLPDVSGWTVLDRLKHDPELRHIPVHIISIDDDWRRGLALGASSHQPKTGGRDKLAEAFGRIQTSIERRVKSLLVVKDDPTQRQNVVDLIGNGDVQAQGAANGQEALSAVLQQTFDCMVVDAELPDMSAAELIEKMQSQAGVLQLPLVVYIGKTLSPEEEQALQRSAQLGVVKPVRSMDHLLDEVSLFLNRVARLPGERKPMITGIRPAEPIFAGRKILLVDDDVRNLFALTSALERFGFEVICAEDGPSGIETLKRNHGIDVVLMDVMMPEVDGYEAIRRIRAIEQFRSLPVIALTAKAMKGDREKCLESGATDYIAKPVDLEQLASMLRVWLYR
jgi:signal transduction histidine kinase/CheY-like chemotaxis protein/HAMP domain-containing protein